MHRAVFLRQNDGVFSAASGSDYVCRYRVPYAKSRGRYVLCVLRGYENTVPNVCELYVVFSDVHFGTDFPLQGFPKGFQ